MTSKERLLIAMKNQQPDRVPVAPDISNMIPCKMTGKPFWDVYLYKNPPLWKANLAASRYFGFDIWGYYATLDISWRNPIPAETKIENTGNCSRRLVSTYHTKKGDMTTSYLYPHDQPAWPEIKLIKNVKEDLFILKDYFAMPDKVVGDEFYKYYCREVGDQGVVQPIVGLPGVQTWEGFIEGGVETTLYAIYDYPELFDEMAEYEKERTKKILEIYLDYRPDSILLGASGLMTLQNVELFRQYSLPTIQMATKMCKEAGVPTNLHACGRSRQLVEILANETDLDCFNPLEDYRTGGDIDLKEVKDSLGDKIALWGNINTTNVMLEHSPAEIKEACRQAIEVAGKGGGFILSTGDQIGRDTPYENIFAMVEAAKEFGQY